MTVGGWVTSIGINWLCQKLHDQPRCCCCCCSGNIGHFINSKLRPSPPLSFANSSLSEGFLKKLRWHIKSHKTHFILLLNVKIMVNWSADNSEVRNMFNWKQSFNQHHCCVRINRLDKCKIFSSSFFGGNFLNIARGTTDPGYGVCNLSDLYQLK